MSIIKTSIAQPITVTVGVILCILAGLIALERVPVEMAPTVEDTVIAVTTHWENANPQEVEQEIIEKQEERLQGLANLRQMTSASRSNEGQIRLEFHAGVDKDAALREVSDKLREVPDYPENVDEPVVAASDPQNIDYIAWMVLYCEDTKVDVRELEDFIKDRLKPILERVPGISEAGIRGGRESEVQIRFDPVLLAQRGITYNQFISAFRTSNANLSGGALNDGKSEVRVRTVGRFNQVDQIKQTVVRHDASGPIHVGDIADVVETFKEPTSFVRSNGRPVIALNFQREIGSNVIEIMKGLKAAIAQVNQPGGLLESYAQARGFDGKLKLIQVFDQTVYIDEAIERVKENIWLGGGLAVLVLLLYLRSARSVGIIALAIPISIIGTIVVMVALGRSINVISLAGMAFAVGMVVDNAIVVLENIYRHLEMGKEPHRAALDATQEVAGAVLAATLTTVVVFIPILLIQEAAGQLFRDIALAICASVSLSLVVSLTVIPSAAALLWRRAKAPEAGKSGGKRPPTGWRVLLDPSRAIGRMVYFFEGSAVFSVFVILLFTAVSIGGSWKLMPPIDYLPQGNRNLVFGIMDLPPGTNLARVDEIGRRVEERIRPFWEAGPGIFGDEKTPLDPSKLPEVPNFPPGMPPFTIQPPPLSRYFFVGLTGTAFHGGLTTDARRAKDLKPLFFWAAGPDVAPGTRSFAIQPPVFRVSGGTGSAVQIDISGPDLSKVISAAERTMGRLIGTFGPFATRSDPNNFSIPNPELRVEPNMIHLTEAGLTMNDLGLAVAANSDGAFIGEFQRAGELVDIKLISSDAVNQKQIPDLNAIPLATGQAHFSGGSFLSVESGNSAHVVPLGSVARVYRTTAPQEIKRVGRQRAVTLNTTPPDGMPVEQAVAGIRKIVDDLRASGDIPPGVSVNMAGSAEKVAVMRTALLGDFTVRGTLTSSLFLALLVVYLLMCVLFQSFVQPLVIMLSVPLATFGGFLALALVHFYSFTDPYMPIQNLDVLTILGFVILAGVVVNNAILIVHQTSNFLREGLENNDGSHTTVLPREAIALAVESRVRPIMMSTLTSVGGMLPLVFMPGSGSELYRGLGSVVVGGLLVSTLFTLFLVPLLLNLVYRIRGWMGLGTA